MTWTRKGKGRTYVAIIRSDSLGPCFRVFVLKLCIQRNSSRYDPLVEDWKMEVHDIDDVEFRRTFEMGFRKDSLDESYDVGTDAEPAGAADDEGDSFGSHGAVLSGAGACIYGE